MSKFFKNIFNNKHYYYDWIVATLICEIFNRYFYGWIAAFICMSLIIIFDLYKWWQFVSIIITFYTVFRYMAYKYLDE